MLFNEVGDCMKRGGNLEGPSKRWYPPCTLAVAAYQPWLGVSSRMLFISSSYLCLRQCRSCTARLVLDQVQLDHAAPFKPEVHSQTMAAEGADIDLMNDACSRGQHLKASWSYNVHESQYLSSWAAGSNHHTSTGNNICYDGAFKCDGAFTTSPISTHHTAAVDQQVQDALQNIMLCGTDQAAADSHAAAMLSASVLSDPRLYKADTQPDTWSADESLCLVRRSRHLPRHWLDSAVPVANDNASMDDAERKQRRFGSVLGTDARHHSHSSQDMSHTTRKRHTDSLKSTEGCLKSCTHLKSSCITQTCSSLLVPIPTATARQKAANSKQKCSSLRHQLAHFALSPSGLPLYAHGFGCNMLPAYTISTSDTQQLLSTALAAPVYQDARQGADLEFQVVLAKMMSAARSAAVAADTADTAQSTAGCTAAVLMQSPGIDDHTQAGHTVTAVAAAPAAKQQDWKEMQQVAVRHYDACITCKVLRSWISTTAAAKAKECHVTRLAQLRW